MKNEFCEFEEVISGALRRGQLDLCQWEHIRACPQCADLQLIWQCLREDASNGGETSALPAPGVIWWRAQLAKKREKARRAVAAIELMQKLASGATLIALVVFSGIWASEDSAGYLSTLLPGAGMLLATAAVLYGWARGRI